MWQSAQCDLGFGNELFNPNNYVVDNLSRSPIRYKYP